MKYAVIVVLALVASSSQVQAQDKGCEHVRCPGTDCEYGPEFNSTLSCNQFCKCIWGEPVLTDCPDGLYFNNDVKECDLPESSGCMGSDEELTTTLDPENPPQNGCEFVRCPSQNGEFALHLANPLDCGSFCKCDWGKAVYFKCPAGLHFNKELQVCDWPEYAGCEGPVVTPPTSKPTTANPTTANPTTANPTTAKPTTANPTTAKPTTANPTTANPTTAKPTTANPTTANPTTANPTTINPITSTLTTGPTTQPGDDDTPTPPPSTEDPLTNGCEFVRCPSQNGEFALHLANPLDCGSFCKCDWGTAVYFKCPAGLHFNKELQVCDWPAYAGCEGPVVTPPTSKPTVKPPTIKPITTTQSGEDETPTAPTQNGCEFVRCPSQNGEFALHLANPLDCGSFCKCDWGKAVYFKCPAGLHFNKELQVCDWPAYAGCEGPVVTPPTSKPTVKPPTIKPITTTQSGGDDTPTPPEPTGCEFVRCPSKNGEFALHLANPLDCSSFCKCDWGKAIHFDCPPGLHFNREKQVCDWPKNAGCIPLDEPEEVPTVENDVVASGEEPTGCEFVRCPSVNGENVLNLANPLDCGSYCRCDWGIAIHMMCPDGLHFNRKNQVCEWPDSAECDSIYK